MADLLFIMLLISGQNLKHANLEITTAILGCNCGKKFLTDKYLIELSDGPAPITARRSAMMRQMGRNLKRHQTGQPKRKNDYEELSEQSQPRPTCKQIFAGNFLRNTLLGRIKSFTYYAF